MSSEQLLEDPTNRVVSVFDGPEQAEAARKELSEAGFKRRSDSCTVWNGSSREGGYFTQMVC